MQVTLDIPDNLAQQLIAAGKDPSREALEALAVEGYRTQRLTESEVRRMLGYETRMQVHALLKEHDVYLHYTLADLELDRQASDIYLAKRAQVSNKTPDK
jgi:predicted HTH domain antitoxin